MDHCDCSQDKHTREEEKKTLIMDGRDDACSGLYRHTQILYKISSRGLRLSDMLVVLKSAYNESLRHFNTIRRFREDFIYIFLYSQPIEIQVFLSSVSLEGNHGLF